MQNDNSQQSKRLRHGNIDGFINPHRQPRPPHLQTYRSSQLPATGSSITDMPHKSLQGKSGLPSQPAGSFINKTIPAIESTQSPNHQNPDSANAAKPSRLTRRFRRLRRKKWSWKRRIAIAAILLVLIALGLGGWDLWQLDHKVNHLAVGNLTASVDGAAS